MQAHRPHSGVIRSRLLSRLLLDVDSVSSQGRQETAEQESKAGLIYV